MTVPSTGASRERRSVLRWTVLAAALLAFAAWEGTQSRRATDAHWSVLAAIACALAAAAVAGRRRQHKPSVQWARDGLGAIGGDLMRRTARPASVVVGIGVWTVLILATIAWNLYSFSREVGSLPTLSRLVGDVTNDDWGRALVFAGWLALGAYLAVGWRRRPADEVVS